MDTAMCMECGLVFQFTACIDGDYYYHWHIVGAEVGDGDLCLDCVRKYANLLQESEKDNALCTRRNA